MSTANEGRDGVAAALAAYLIWGLVPIFFKHLADVPALEIIAHRVVWSVGMVGALLLFTQGFGAVREVLVSPRKLARVAVGAALVMSNWFVFVWAVNAGRILETSLGYFIGPLLNVALGMLLLGERLRPLQALALVLAALGVANEAWRVGHIPLVSLTLATTFSLYGLMRKQLPMDAASGLFAETAVAMPFALGWLLWLAAHGEGAFGATTTTDGLLVASGLVTALPLLLFAIGARRLRLTTMGFLQYLAPSLTFLLAVLVYGEALDLARGLTFAAIWAGLALYSIDLLRAGRGIEGGGRRV
jgi:chloramphenicol-sensitive protein RarD